MEKKVARMAYDAISIIGQIGSYYFIVHKAAILWEGDIPEIQSDIVCCVTISCASARHSTREVSLIKTNVIARVLLAIVLLTINREAVSLASV